MFVPADGQRAGLLDIIRMGGPGRARGPGASNLDLSDFIVSVISVPQVLFSDNEGLVSGIIG